MGNAPSAVVLNPEFWTDRTGELVAILRQSGGQARRIADPSGRVASPDRQIEIFGGAHWGRHPDELRNALSRALGDPEAVPGGGVGTAPGGVERLTYTVEEAAKMLGISRAFAYDAVNRGEIPHIRIGRRVLIPRSKLNELLAVSGE